jgi:WD40 repeat protein
MTYRAFMSYSRAADGALAPRVQSALHRLARPFFSPRALHVFRDQTNLAASPGLWSSIESALDRSEFFILMAAPESAASPWVRREVDHWLTRSPAAGRGEAVVRFLIVLTDGEIVWDDEAGDFDWSRTDALPELLRGVFPEEPLYVDLRAARTAEALSLDNPEFRSRIADLAAPLHGRSKEELIGEDVRIARRNRRAGWAVGITLAVLAVSATAAAWVAETQRRSARSRELAARALVHLEIDPVAGLQRALDAVAVAATPDAVAALREALIRSSVRAVLRPPSGAIVDAAFSPDGATLLTAVRTPDGAGALVLRDAASGAPRCEVGDATGGHFVDRGARLRTDDGRLLAAATCRPDGDAPPPAGSTSPAGEDDAAGDPETAAYPDWTRAVFRDASGTREVAYQDEVAVVREAGTGRLLRALRGSPDPIGGAAFSEGDGLERRIVTWPVKGFYQESGGGPTEIGEKVARLWGERYDDGDGVLAGHRRAVNTAAFGPAAEVVVTGSDDRTARLWIARSREEFAVLRGHAGGIHRVAMSADGGSVLTVSADGTARLWKPGTARPVSISFAELYALQHGVTLPDLAGDARPVRPLERSADGGTVLGRIDHAHLRIWSARTGEHRATLQDDDYGDLRGWLSPDGARVVTTTGDSRVAAGSETARVREVATGREVARLEGGGGVVYWAGFSPDGTRIVTATDAGLVHLWDARTFGVAREFRAAEGRVLHAAFDARGTRLVTSSRDSFVRVWDARTGELLLELFGHEGGALSAVFSPDDALVVSVGEDGTRVWDAATGKMLGRYLGSGAPGAFITPDCAALVTSDDFIDSAEVRIHEFGACGPLDRMRAVARTRLPHDRTPP